MAVLRLYDGYKKHLELKDDVMRALTLLGY